jgi:hypothetical protein
MFFLRKRLARLVSLVDVSFEVIVTCCFILRLYVPLVCTVSLPILIAGKFIYRANGFYFVAGRIEFPIFWQSFRYPGAVGSRALSHNAACVADESFENFQFGVVISIPVIGGTDRSKM